MANTTSADGSAAGRAPNGRVACPWQGFGRVATEPQELLLLCFYDPGGISTVPETVAFMQSASRYSVTVLNLFERRLDTGFLKLSPHISFEPYAVVAIHNSVSYNVDNLRSLDVLMAQKLKQYRGVKVLMKQDENHRFRDVAAYIGEVGFDLVFTCLPPEAIPYVYPSELVGAPRFERMLTGYVTPTLREMSFPRAERPIDIGYRGSIQPLSFGRLAYEKRKIGDDVEALLAGRGLTLDISSRWEDRFGGDVWFDFLRSCKATLGVESGASVFDLRGDLERRCKEMERRLGPIQEDHDYAEKFLGELADLEDNVHYHQISPRHFEAIATGTVQLLYPGEYSGRLVSGRHYFPLARDYSNLNGAVELIRDEGRRQDMARAARDEVLLNPENWIEQFVKRFDDQVEELIRLKGLAVKPVVSTPSDHNVLLIAAHEPGLDPRLGWIEEGAAAGCRVHQLGVLPPEAPQPKTVESPRGNVTLSYPRAAWRSEIGDGILSRVGMSPAGMAGIQELLFLEHALAGNEERFCEIFGAPPGCERNAQFRWYLRYLLDTAATLLDKALQMRGIHAVIATDLDTMPAALVIKGVLGVPVFYDAHEYWPEADLASLEYEKQFWVGLERRMVAHADYRQTVSPGLALLMSSQYGVPFATVPNCEPKSRMLPYQVRSPRGDGQCHFLYQGNFAVGRGIDLLVEAWSGTDERAILQLRGPDNAYKQEMMALAGKTRLLGSRIFFPAAVRESDMIQAASAADVGLIPYTPSGITYKFCCPNKLSQYMAAGLPILANATEYVASIVQTAGCGRVVDFSRRAQIVRAVAELTEHSELRGRLGKAGWDFARSRFNWNVVSEGLYEALKQAISLRVREPFRLFDIEGKRHLSFDTATGGVVMTADARLEQSAARRMLRAVWHCVPKNLRRRLFPVTSRITAATPKS